MIRCLFLLNHMHDCLYKVSCGLMCVSEFSLKLKNLFLLWIKYSYFFCVCGGFLVWFEGERNKNEVYEVGFEAWCSSKWWKIYQVPCSSSFPPFFVVFLRFLCCVLSVFLGCFFFLWSFLVSGMKLMCVPVIWHGIWTEMLLLLLVIDAIWGTS